MVAELIIPNQDAWLSAVKRLYKKGDITLNQYAQTLRRIGKRRSNNGFLKPTELTR